MLAETPVPTPNPLLAHGDPRASASTWAPIGPDDAAMCRALGLLDPPPAARRGVTLPPPPAPVRRRRSARRVHFSAARAATAAAWLVAATPDGGRAGVAAGPAAAAGPPRPRRVSRSLRNDRGMLPKASRQVQISALAAAYPGLRAQSLRDALAAPCVLALPRNASYQAAYDAARRVAETALLRRLEGRGVEADRIAGIGIWRWGTRRASQPPTGFADTPTMARLRRNTELRIQRLQWQAHGLAPHCLPRLPALPVAPRPP